jgi:hypothetical protein
MSDIPRTLVVIHSDPRESARAAEGVRIAAGVGTWKKTDITLLLRGPAGYCLGEFVDDLKDEDNFTRYLPIVAEWKRPIYLAGDFTDLDALEGSPWKFERVNEEQIALIYSENQYFIHM